jgi:DNA-binding transcriptional LysR family regulator
MLDAVSLDQPRTFVAAVEGSFSAASRKLLRAQSVVSEAISNLEEQIGVKLFDRSGRYPKLTPAGLAIVGDARSIITVVDLLKARAKGTSAGQEPELSVVIDVFYPIDAVTQVAKEFRQKYPGVALRIMSKRSEEPFNPCLTAVAASASQRRRHCSPGACGRPEASAPCPPRRSSLSRQRTMCWRCSLLLH